MAEQRTCNAQVDGSTPSCGLGWFTLRTRVVCCGVEATFRSPDRNGPTLVHVIDWLKPVAQRKGIIMSYYYSYYVGYMLKGQVYPLGPYTNTGELRAVVTKSSSYASNLHYLFSELQDSEISEELKKEFTYKTYSGESVVATLKFLPVDNLPSGDYIKSGYFLIKDVQRYKDCEDFADKVDFDGFYERLDPEVYSAKLANEYIFGRRDDPRHEDDDEEVMHYSAADYMFYAYPDYRCQEYESRCLQLAVSYLLNYNMPKGAEPVIIETEG